MTFLRVGMQDPEYSHVLSFRRQIFISPLENASIPDSFLISFDNTSYRIYISIDGLNCSRCKTVGHQDSDCPSLSSLSSPINQTETDHQVNVLNSANKEYSQPEEQPRKEHEEGTQTLKEPKLNITKNHELTSATNDQTTSIQTNKELQISSQPQISQDSSVKRKVLCDSSDESDEEIENITKDSSDEDLETFLANENEDDSLGQQESEEILSSSKLKEGDFVLVKLASKKT
ncbi:nucleoplasmin-like protein ANO39 [Diabrotica virgifera virgifera]|uniref:CCHC-type domain-containing protein n=1 Tax=Diabrotica virgifera virgifera TaxID=50390 RepID=A0ABM5KS61_DIAVI|nr:nucleoplasmin-like protein ANO39 [Diabrotica virgifera virgifera]